MIVAESGGQPCCVSPVQSPIARARWVEHHTPIFRPSAALPAPEIQILSGLGVRDPLARVYQWVRGREARGLYLSRASSSPLLCTALHVRMPFFLPGSINLPVNKSGNACPALKITWRLADAKRPVSTWCEPAPLLPSCLESKKSL